MNVTLSGSRVFAVVIKLEEITHWVRVDANPVTGVYRRELAHAHTHTGKTSCDNRGRDWTDTTPSCRTPRTASNRQKTGRGGEGFFPSALRESMARLAA